MTNRVKAKIISTSIGVVAVAIGIALKMGEAPTTGSSGADVLIIFGAVPVALNMIVLGAHIVHEYF